MNKLVEKAYRYLPPLFQNLGISIYGLYWHHKRFGGVFPREVRAAQEREFYSAEQWRAYQTRQLRKLLIHAIQHVPFYREKYSRAGWTVEKFAEFELEDLSKLPFLEKDDLRRFGTTELLSEKKKRGSFISSSGSTGTPVKVFLPEYFHQTWNALMETRVRKWAGVDGQTPRGMIGGRRVLPGSKAEFPLYRYNFIEKQTYFSAYHLGPGTVHNYIEGLNKNRVHYLTGYAMSIYTLARLTEEKGLLAPQLRAVITSSEKMTDEMRGVIERVFQCRVFDSYSGCEACGLISQNSLGELLFSPDSGILEVLDRNNQPVLPGGIGEVVSTGLHNLDQPLIRYRIGDRVKLGQQQASKHSMPVIEEILGRVEDVIIGPDGREMVRFHALFTDITGLVEGQIIQKKIDSFQLNLVVDQNAERSEIEQRITQRLLSQLGDVYVEFVYVSNLPRSNSGKFKAVISELKHG